jgi:predicted acylesterase/phospholipase RssA
MARKFHIPGFDGPGVEVAKRWPEWKRVLERRAKPKTRDTLGIALSGGGYRSAIFCYGVLRGLHEIGVLSRADYLSVVSGGSWIGMAYATTAYLDDYFFDKPAGKPNFLEEGFESFLANPFRLAEELALTRATPNYVSDVFGRLLAGTFLREHGQNARFSPLGSGGLVQDKDRPFLIVNGTVNYRPEGKFEVFQECFEMTRLYSGSRSLGYADTRDVKSLDKELRVRDAIAVSGAAVAFHLPGIGDEVHGVGLSREIVNFARGATGAPTDDALDVADGGHYNNLGVESLVNRGCGYLIVVDAEHDPERKQGGRSNQKFTGLRTLMKRHHIHTAFGVDTGAAIAKIDRPGELVHEFTGDASIPDVLYIKLKSSAKFDAGHKSQPYNQPGFLRNLFGQGEFHFDPQFSTAKLDYEFAEHRNLSELGTFIVKEHAKQIADFARRAR